MRPEVCPAQLLEGLHKLVRFVISTSAQAAVTSHTVHLTKESHRPMSSKFVTAVLPGSSARKVTMATEQANTTKNTAFKQAPSPSLILK